MCFLCVVYDQNVFHNPETFDPFRWSKSHKSESDKVDTTKATQADTVSLPLSSSTSETTSASTLDGFLGFSFGPRTCLGHKFAKIEAVAFLTLLLRDWRVEPVLKPGETPVAWRARVLRPHFGMTLSFGEVPVRLVRRK